ncbi:MAG: class I SAM-dependent methyltransferase [Chitinophagaceae bacterium]|nr:MAG: class I SAM-dependent methyltransferase [Chitinophagaceae bacterium]
MFLRPQKRRLLHEINDLPFGQLLEIGIGNGRHLPLYQTHKVTGIDSSPVMVELAKKNKNQNMELFNMNGENLSFKDNSYDYVVLSHVIAVVDDPEKILKEIDRVLKPGGKLFILNHFTPENWLRHIDQSFQSFSKFLHFKSVFYLSSLGSLERFKLLNEINFGRFSYFKLLIYGKA